MSDVSTDDLTAPRLAQAFHEAYERLAPEHGYETRKASAVPWEDVPENNRTLMVHVVAEVVVPIIGALSGDVARLTAERIALRDYVEGQWTLTENAERERDEALARETALRDALIDLCSDLANERITAYEAAMRAKHMAEEPRP